MMAKIDLKLLRNQAQKAIDLTKDLKELNDIFKRYLGKRGQLTQVLRSLEKLPETKRAKVGKEANELKSFLRIKCDQKAREIKEKIRKETAKTEWIDITRPGERPALGHLHPLSQVKNKTEEIFQLMGFSVVEGPEIENEWYNFDALNIPKDHPARDIWDTLWLKPEVRSPNSQRLLLRTHTSPVQIRYMEKNNPPLRIIVPGRVFRHEATDASHEINFYQIEGLMVDKKISVANFKAIIQHFFQQFFSTPGGEKSIGIRLRPGYFPFVEPGFEVDMICLACGGRGCSVCSQTGWLEMMGAGMVHPNVFKAAGLNPKNWQGFAFGMGLDRLAMMKHKINDIRLFYSGDLRFLNQF